MSRRFLLLWAFVASSQLVLAQKDLLRQKIVELAGEVNGQVGVAIMDLSSKDTLLYNVNGIFPMQSVYKFPLALAVLHHVDQKKLSLDQTIKLTKRDLLPNTWSPMAKRYTEGAVVTLREVLMYTVTHSDNNGCDVLFRLLGGTGNVQEYIHNTGIKEIGIAATEEEMHRTWDVQFSNWCKPTAMLELLNKFYDKKLLSRQSQDLLWSLLVETSTGPNRIKGLLPKGTIVAHRTGLGDTNKEGVTGAVNDVGIVTLPSGKHFAIVLYFGRVKDDVKEIERVMAEIALAAYESRWLND